MRALSANLAPGMTQLGFELPVDVIGGPRETGSMLARLARGLPRFRNTSRWETTLTRQQHTQAQHRAEADADEIEDFRETVRSWAAQELAPRAADIDRNNSFPTDVNMWTAMGDMGLHGPPPPRPPTLSTFLAVPAQQMHRPRSLRRHREPQR